MGPHQWGWYSQSTPRRSLSLGLGISELTPSLGSLPGPRKGSHPVGAGTARVGQGERLGVGTGLPSRRSSGVLLRLAGNTRTPVFMGRQVRPPPPRDALGGGPAAGSGQHQRQADGQADQRVASTGRGGAGSERVGGGRGAPPPKRAPYQGASWDNRAGERPPPRPPKGKKGARGPTAALSALSLPAALRKEEGS